MEDATERLRAWATEVEAAYADGGYAAGDGPTVPLDEVLAVLAENERLRAALQGLTRAGEATVTAGHPTDELLTSLVWAQEALRAEQ